MVWGAAKVDDSAAGVLDSFDFRSWVPEAAGMAVAHLSVEVEDGIPAPGYDGKIRQTEECIDYTSCHLPTSICRAPEFKKEDANLAILAARMAFSSLYTLSRLK